MNMHSHRTVIAGRFTSWDQPVVRNRQEPIVIGLVNNMPDAALRATERQFCALLSAASRDLVVRLKLFSFAEIERSPTARSHIARYYDEISELEDTPLDGLIVTGTEPRAHSLQDEPYWPALSRLVDWTQENAISSVWSCLAAHAAVLRLDGIERRALGSKLSGVFECGIDSSMHDIMRGTPDRWRVPHSRLYGVSEQALAASGYDVLSRSAEAGADVFIKQGRALSLFFQGHPEYGPAALLGEYRRDITRFLNRERDAYPDLPRGYFSARAAGQLDEFRARAERTRSPDLLEDLTALLAGAAQHSPWSPAATQLYTNWLTHLDEQRAQNFRFAVPFRQAAEPAHTAA